MEVYEAQINPPERPDFEPDAESSPEIRVSMGDFMDDWMQDSYADGLKSVEWLRKDVTTTLSEGRVHTRKNVLHAKFIATNGDTEVFDEADISGNLAEELDKYKHSTSGWTITLWQVEDIEIEDDEVVFKFNPADQELDDEPDHNF